MRKLLSDFDHRTFWFVLSATALFIVGVWSYRSNPNRPDVHVQAGR